MKKLLPLMVMVLLTAPVFGQTMRVFFSTNAVNTGCDTDVPVWHCSSSWVEAKQLYNGDLQDLTSDNYGPDDLQAVSIYPGVISGSKDLSNIATPHVVVIRKGHSIYLTEYMLYNGYIIVEPGATLYFSKNNENKGRLAMQGLSVGIDLRWGSPVSGDIMNIGNGLAADFLVINGDKINGHWINALPSPLPDLVDENGNGINIVIDNLLMACIEKDFKIGHVWTVEDLKKLLTCAGQITPQPVELSLYSARAIGNEVEISWEAAREWDFSHYVIEWSTDAKNFSVAASVAAKGTQNGKQRYNLFHKPNTTGTVYYRLLSVDIDGTVADKGMQVLRLGTDVFNAYAKNGRLIINYNGPADSQVVLYEPSGRIINAQQLTAEGIETAGIVPGLYLLQISNSLEKKAIRVLIQ